MEPAQQPVAVDARMPIEAAMEERMKLAWGARVFRSAQNVARLVRIFARDVPEGDAGEAGCEFRRQNGRHSVSLAFGGCMGNVRGASSDVNRRNFEWDRWLSERNTARGDFQSPR